MIIETTPIIKARLLIVYFREIITFFFLGFKIRVRKVLIVDCFETFTVFLLDLSSWLATWPAIMCN